MEHGLTCAHGTGANHAHTAKNLEDNSSHDTVWEDERWSIEMVEACSMQLRCWQDTKVESAEDLSEKAGSYGRRQVFRNSRPKPFRTSKVMTKILN